MRKLVLAGLLFVVGGASATHLRTAVINVERVSCANLTFKIKLTVYTDLISNTPVSGTLSFGDGQSVAVVPTLGPNLAPGIGVATFAVTHTYATISNFKINYFTGDRNSAILNMFEPWDAKFDVYVLITAASIQNCNRYITLSILPFDKACSGVTFTHNSGASDPDFDSISYEMTIPFKDATLPVDGYVSPVAAVFYTNFNQGNEAKNGPPSLVIDGLSGTITWNAPGRVGEYNIAFKILEWRRNASTGLPELMSTTIRDMQITVEACPNKRPDIIIPEDLCVVAGTIIDKKIIGVDPDNDNVKIEFVSDAFTVSFQPPTLTPSLVEFRPSNPADTVQFHWQTDCLHVREQAYQIVIKITDSPHSGTTLVTFKTWKIKIIAPMPVWKNVSLDLVNRKAILKWEPYSCSNAQFIQVWRKVGHYTYNPGQCDAGLPKYLGYELIGEVNSADTIFTDNNSTMGLVDGALYCYRLVAAFVLPAGGKSYVTIEQCVGPILTDAPVITHVSVESTDTDLGAIRVSWRSPFDIDDVLFPKPYQYHVYRGDGFSAEAGLLKVGEVMDTTFLNTNLNTSDSVYNYRIVIYSKPDGYPNFIAVDTSFAASSVRLNAASGEGKIELTWMTTVPWSNTIEGSPFHYVYRGSKDETQLTFLAKADVTENGFVFADETVDPKEYYCYTVMTRGTYGNPLVDTLRNFSQRVCLYPKNDLLPCQPILTVATTNCDDFLQAADCQVEFKNNLTWAIPDQSGCRIDIVGYKVYAASTIKGEFVLIQEAFTETNFVEFGLTSFARCYKITSVDMQGLESEASEIACNDNCPYFDLPNVFTPGNMDGCNDTFRAFNSFGIEDQPCLTAPKSLCLQFVNAVQFKVYDRWGKEVYSSSTANGLPPSIEWKGLNNKGNELESGVYYYWAAVDFNVLDESKKYKALKGWVHLVRE